MLIAGNWKSNTTLPEAVRLAEAVAEAVGTTTVDVAVCPPLVSLDAVYNALRGSSVKLGAQNLSATDAGAYTGEVTGAMLKSVGCTYAIVGHSERRQYYGETDTVVAEKVARAQAAGLVPILCVGETLEERRAGRVEAVVETQLSAALQHVDPARLVIAYEPVWAIGTGETATPEQAQEVHAFIRQQLAARFGAEAARTIAVLYGGSMKASNAAELLTQPDVDGGLIGGASLDAAGFSSIVRAAEQAA